MERYNTMAPSFETHKDGPMIVGYARVSTKEQSLDIQVEDLKRHGCEKIFTDKSSGGNMERPGLIAMLEYVRDGDMVICMKTDRIARDTIHSLSIADTLKEKDCGLKLMDLGDTDINSTMGRVIYTIIAALAQAERERIRERCEKGRKAAIEKGVHMGRPCLVQLDQIDQIVSLMNQGISQAQIARDLSVSRQTVWRALKKADKKAA